MVEDFCKTFMYERTHLQDCAINAIDRNGAGIVVECQRPARESILHFTCSSSE